MTTLFNNYTDEELANISSNDPLVSELQKRLGAVVDLISPLPGESRSSETVERMVNWEKRVYPIVGDIENEEG